MEMATFAVENGYAEGILRGLRSSFLTEQQYMQVKNCTNLGELKSVPLHLSSVPGGYRLRTVHAFREPQHAHFSAAFTPQEETR